MLRACMVLALSLAASAAAAAQVEVPLTVAERAGVARADNPVHSGVPLPVGAVKDVSELALFDAAGRPVDAAVVERCRWLKDNSVKFVTVHFTCDLPAKGTAKYVLKTAKATPAKTLKVDAADGAVTVDTGSLKFVVKKNGFNLFDQVWLDGTEVVAPGTASLTFIGTEGNYVVRRKVAKVNLEGKSYTTKTLVDKLTVEERSPTRVVVKATGGLMRDDRRVLDFTARIYAMAGSSSVRVMFTIINKVGREFSHFVGLKELSFTVPLRNAGGGLRYRFGAVADPDTAGTLKPGQKATLLQLQSTKYTVDGKELPGGRDQLSRRLGWADLSGAKAGLAVGVRYFWQLFPKGLEVTGDGSIKAMIVAPLEKLPPEGERPPLFCGAARTHEILFAFHKGGEDGRARAMAVVDPLFAAAPPAWYCQKTWAFGRIVDANPNDYKPEYRDLVKKFQAKLEDSLKTVLSRRDGKRQGVEEYGFFNFGCQPHHGSLVKKGDWLNSAWNGNYYDYPFAVLLNFVRTGSYQSWDVAQEHGLHLADIDVCHYHPTNPELHGIERMGYTFGHFRQWWSGRRFGVSGNADSTKNQSLYHLYYLTGDRWFLDVALLVSNYNAVHGGGALRAVGNRMLGLYGSYEATHDPKHLARLKGFMEKQGLGRARRGLRRWDQDWMYGLIAEPMMKYYKLTDDKRFAAAVKTCCDSLIKNFWRGPEFGTKTGLHGFTANCFGYAYELTGNEAYLKKGIVQIERVIALYCGRTKGFAQQFRLSPQFLYYLSKDYTPPAPVLK